MLVVKSQEEFAPVMAELHKECFNTPWCEEDIKSLLNLPTTIGWITEEGFLLCSQVLNEMEILTICVLPQFRKKKIATQLLSAMTKYAQEQNVSKIFLEVSIQNIPAQNLYQKFGFIQTGIRKNYYQTSTGKVDALCLTKTL